MYKYKLLLNIVTCTDEHAALERCYQLCSLYFLGELQLADHAHPQNKLHKFTENDIATN